jgi:HlyD family secretion protein
VSLEIVREERDSVLRIHNGPAIGRGNEHRVYVLQNGNAIELEIVTGLVGEAYVEVLEGLSEGERVLLSDVSSVEDLNVVKLR